MKFLQNPAGTFSYRPATRPSRELIRAIGSYMEKAHGDFGGLFWQLTDYVIAHNGRNYSVILCLFGSDDTPAKYTAVVRQDMSDGEYEIREGGSLRGVDPDSWADTIESATQHLEKFATVVMKTMGSPEAWDKLEV